MLFCSDRGNLVMIAFYDLGAQHKTEFYQNCSNNNVLLKNILANKSSYCG